MEGMALSDFVSGSISQIFEGVSRAQESVKEFGGRVCPGNVRFATKDAGPRAIYDSSQGVLIENIDFAIGDGKPVSPV